MTALRTERSAAAKSGRFFAGKVAGAAIGPFLALTLVGCLGASGSGDDPDLYAYRQAERSNSIEEIAAFIEANPQSKYIEKARKRHAELLHSYATHLEDQLSGCVVAGDLARMTRYLDLGAAPELKRFDGASFSGRDNWEYLTDKVRTQVRYKQGDCRRGNRHWHSRKHYTNRRTAYRSAQPVMFATALGYKDILRTLISRGADINGTDALGNTALHVAYFLGKDDFVRFLLDAGASQTIENRIGLVPSRMVAGWVEYRLVARTIALLDGRKNPGYSVWTDKERGRELFDQLKRRDPKKVMDALVHMIAYRPSDRGDALVLAVRLGLADGEDRLLATLPYMYNSEKRNVLVTFLNSGSPRLENSARAYAQRIGLKIVTRAGAPNTRWGRF